MPDGADLVKEESGKLRIRQYALSERTRIFFNASDDIVGPPYDRSGSERGTQMRTYFLIS